MIEVLIKHYSRHRETIQNLAWRSLQIFGKQGITFLIFVLCAKLLTPYNFGIYNYALAIILILIMFGDFGISTATSKYVAQYNVTDKEKLKAVLFNSTVLILIITVVVCLITIVIGPVYLKDKYIYILYILPLIFLAPMTSLYDGIYRGLKKFKQAAIISLIVGFVSIVFVYFLIRAYGLSGALISQDIFYLILLISLATGHRDFTIKINREVISELGKYSVIIGLSSVGLILYSKIDTIFLGHYNFIVEVSYYEIINKLLGLILIPFAIFAQVISPSITERYSRCDYAGIYEKYKKYVFFSLIISIGVVATLFILKDVILDVFFSAYDTEVMHKMFSIMLIVFFTQMLNGVVPLGFVISTGHAKLSTYFLVIFGVVHIVLNYIFLMAFGYIGIIYSIVITRCCADLLFLLYYKRILKCLILK